MERGKVIRPENDDLMMSNSTQLKHPSEVLLKIQTTDNEEEIQEILTSDSHTPHKPLYIGSSSKPKSNNNIQADWTLYYSNSISKIPDFNSYPIEHPDDWGHISPISDHISEITKEIYSDQYSIEIEKGKSSNYSDQIGKVENINSNSQIGKDENSNNSGKRKKGKNIKMTGIYPRPEQKLIKFAFNIVIIEKTASGIGLLSFIWATAVLLGGFASALKTIDFGFITMIIFMVGTGVFNRNHQLDSRFFVQATKAISGTIGRNLTILQFSFASICITLSLLRLVDHYYSKDPHTTNMKVALYIFYAMALVHGVLFLLKKAYWFWIVYYSKIIQEVCEECKFGDSGVLLVQRFFYEAYWKLSKGSVFCALDLNFLTFAQGLFISNSNRHHIIAIRILNGFINHEKYSAYTCRRLETSTETIGRLFKMLTWKYQEDGIIQITVANIVERLANRLLVEEIPGAMDCIYSLLNVPQKPQDLNEITLKLNLLGLKILKNLAGNPKNCCKIMEMPGLLSVIVEFSKYKNKCTPHPPHQFKIVKRSLMLLSKLTSMEGETGNILRNNISKIAFMVSNLRDNLINGGTNPKLYCLVVEILITLSMDMDARKKIGRTFGIIKVLSTIYLQLSCTSYECELRVKTGAVLAMLVLQSKRNCSEILNLKGAVEKLIQILSPVEIINSNLGVSYWKIDRRLLKRKIPIHTVEFRYKIMAMKILRNLCAYAARKWHDKLREVVDASALQWVFLLIMSTKDDYESLEASIGLGLQICKFISIKQYTEILEGVCHSLDDVAKKILKILKENNTPNNMFPCLRRYAIELAIWMMESNAPSILDFKAGKFGKVLTKVAETSSDLENYHFFSGDVGVAKHPQTISSLVLKAKRLLE